MIESRCSNSRVSGADVGLAWEAAVASFGAALASLEAAVVGWERLWCGWERLRCGWERPWRDWERPWREPKVGAARGAIDVRVCDRRASVRYSSHRCDACNHDSLLRPAMAVCFG